MPSETSGYSRMSCSEGCITVFQDDRNNWRSAELNQRRQKHFLCVHSQCCQRYGAAEFISDVLVYNDIQ